MRWLRTRLGKAITQRRQYLRYCREHREKLSKVSETKPATELPLEPNSGTTFLAVHGQQTQHVDGDRTVISKPTSTLASTTASTMILAKLENSESQETLEEQNDDDDRSRTSYATSLGEDGSDDRLSVIHLQDIATPGQSFECPYCWTIQKFNYHYAWR
jgi:hypothetical protein